MTDLYEFYLKAKQGLTVIGREDLTGHCKKEIKRIEDEAGNIITRILEFYVKNVLTNTYTNSDLWANESNKQQLENFFKSHPSLHEHLDGNARTLDKYWSAAVVIENNRRGTIFYSEECPFTLAEILDKNFYPTINKKYKIVFGLHYKVLASNVDPIANKSDCNETRIHPL